MPINLQVGVKIFLKNKDGEYLLLRRNAEKYKNTSGFWDIVGGRIIPGTSLLENLKREIKEETQLDLKGEARLIAAQDILKLETHIVRLTYAADIEGAPVLDDEHIDFKWLLPKEIKKMEGLDSYVAELLEMNVLHETYSRT